MARRPTQPKRVKSITHDGATRPNNPTAELEGLVRKDEAKPKRVDYPRRNNPDEVLELYHRNEDIDPQLVWMGKDEEDREPLSVDALPIYTQEHIHPKAIVEDIRRRAQQDKVDAGEDTPDLFADWAEELNPEDRVEFYQHQQKWTNRMILGDSLQVMTSLVEKEGMKGKVQCIYMDPPYGIKFASNWQTSTKSRSVKENDLSREPETIKAFRDTWEHGIHSYLSYLRDRLTVARDLLSPSGSVFVQIGDENVHLVRSLMDEVFGKENFVAMIYFQTAANQNTHSVQRLYDIVIYYGKSSAIKINQVFREREKHEIEGVFTGQDEISSRVYKPAQIKKPENKPRFLKSGRLDVNHRSFKRYLEDAPYQRIDNVWTGTIQSTFASDKIYVVQTTKPVIQRCLMLATNPGDIVLDPTCGSGTTAYVAEQWGRRWITMDTSRVSLTLARTRLMGAHFDYYLLNDSIEGARKELEISGNDITRDAYGHNVSNGFVLERFDHIKQSAIANNAEIDTIWDKWQDVLEPLRAALNTATGNSFEEWEIPREAQDGWNAKAAEAHSAWWDARINRQQEIDDSIARNASIEYLHDKPYKQSGVVRVTGPFTVESLSPHRILPSDAEDDAILAALREEDDSIPETISKRLRPASIEEGETKFHDVVFENLRKVGVQNTKKDERMEFIALDHWDGGKYIQFDGRYLESGKEKKAAICIGPEYGTVTRSLLVQAAREAADSFDVLVVLGFAFEAYADDDLVHIGRMRVLRVRMNNDLHMGDRLKSTQSGNLFVMFGEPDIAMRAREDGLMEVEILGVDIFDPTTGEVKASGPEDIACWFIDTDYNEEAFFVRHAYFSGGGQDPYKRLKTTLKAEIDIEAWDALYSTVSRPFPKPPSKRIAVKAINHYGDEVLRVFDV